MKKRLSTAEYDASSGHSKIDVIFLQNLDQSFRRIVPAYVRKGCPLIVTLVVDAEFTP